LEFRDEAPSLDDGLRQSRAFIDHAESKPIVARTPPVSSRQAFHEDWATLTLNIIMLAALAFVLLLIACLVPDI
jgi:hypothetical protein